MSDVELAVCIIHTENVSSQWAFQRASLELPESHAMLRYAVKAPYDIARQKITEDALKLNPKYLFFLDSDIIPQNQKTVKLLIKHLERHRLDILSGLYWIRHSPPRPCAFTYHKDKKNRFKPLKITKEHTRNGHILRCDVTGAGCLLVTKTVFDLFTEEYPGEMFWRWGYGLPRDELERLHLESTSEDFNFFLKMNKLDIYPYVDCTVPCDHITLGRIGGSDGHCKPI